jgi:integrase
MFSIPKQFHISKNLLRYEWPAANLRNRQLDPMCEELKIPKVGWHSLRHSNATLLDAVGTPLGTVQSLQGHSSSEITRGTYIHSLPAGAREAVQKVEDLLTGPKLDPSFRCHLTPWFFVCPSPS